MLLRKFSACTLFLVPFWLIAGCGRGPGADTSSPTLSVPYISTQPQNQSVPMGLAATYRVTATGSGLEYQWLKDGSPISGATGATYTTPITAFSDTGDSFTVTVSNAAGVVASSAASLTVTARAPKAGDLRFLQVDAATTVNGFQPVGGDIPEGCPPPGGGGITITDPAGTGTPYFLDDNSCIMRFQTFALPGNLTGMETVYTSLSLSDFPALLTDAFHWSPGPSPSDSGSVIQSLWLNSPYGGGLSFMHSDSVSGFSGQSFTVPIGSLQDAATQEGQHGRVITALSSDGTQVTYFSYSWSGDPSTVYESKVTLATLDTTVAAVTDLANQGYILTASGGTEAADGSGVVLVGTRVQGDTMPRPIQVATETGAVDLNALMSAGYAIVAAVQQYNIPTNAGFIQYIGER